MAKESAVVKDETPVAAPRKRVFGKKLVNHAPVVDLEIDQSIEAKIALKRAEVKTKFGATPMLILELLEPFVQTKGLKRGDKPKEFKAGETVGMFVKAGLAAAMELPEGTECRITCTGSVPTDKGNPAFTFDVEYG